MASSPSYCWGSKREVLLSSLPSPAGEVNFVFPKGTWDLLATPSPPDRDSEKVRIRGGWLEEEGELWVLRLGQDGRASRASSAPVQSGMSLTVVPC